MTLDILNKEKGFTLIELLVVMAIIAILGTVGVTAYIGSATKAARSEAYANLEALKVLQTQLVAETGAYATPQGACAPNSPNVVAIQGVLPGFQPGNAFQYSYCILQNVTITGAALTPCFTAQAWGNTTGRGAGDFFQIDCNNNSNY